jgi:hypothetical protein
LLIEISVVQDSPHREALGRRQRILEKITWMEQQTTAKLKRLDVRLEDRAYDREVKPPPDRCGCARATRIGTHPWAHPMSMNDRYCS